MIDRVQQQPLMRRRWSTGTARVVEQRGQHAEPGLLVAARRPRRDCDSTRDSRSRPCARDRRRRAVDRLVVVERIGRAVRPVAERAQAGRAGVPVGHAVGCGAVLDVEVAGRARRVEHPALRSPRVLGVRRSSSSAASREELELFGEAGHRPGQPAGPGRERRIALLRCSGRDSVPLATLKRLSCAVRPRTS